MAIAGLGSARAGVVTGMDANAAIPNKAARAKLNTCNRSRHNARE
jgi:hypothetical protein